MPEVKSHLQMFVRTGAFVCRAGLVLSVCVCVCCALQGRRMQRACCWLTSPFRPKYSTSSAAAAAAAAHCSFVQRNITRMRDNDWPNREVCPP